MGKLRRFTGERAEESPAAPALTLQLEDVWLLLGRQPALLLPRLLRVHLCNVLPPAPRAKAAPAVSSPAKPTAAAPLPLLTACARPVPPSHLRSATVCHCHRPTAPAPQPSTPPAHLISTSIEMRCSSTPDSRPSRMPPPARPSASPYTARRYRHCVLRSRSLWGKLATTSGSRRDPAVGTSTSTCRPRGRMRCRGEAGRRAASAPGQPNIRTNRSRRV